MSQVASTNAFDKNPQSKERGITLDLGFSSLVVPTPPHLAESGGAEMQITLVDCPGHASLIRTIIGGVRGGGGGGGGGGLREWGGRRRSSI